MSGFQEDRSGHYVPSRRSVEEGAGLADISPALPDGVSEKDLVLLNDQANVEISFNPAAPAPIVELAESSIAPSPPPQYPAPEASSSRPPPPFSSLYNPTPDPEAVASVLESFPALRSPVTAVADEEGAVASTSTAAPAYALASVGQTASGSSFSNTAQGGAASARLQDETKRALCQGAKGDKSRGFQDDDLEPPPAYSEGSSPILSFTYVMAAAGGASSIITQVQQGGPPINALGGKSWHRNSFMASADAIRCRFRRDNNDGPSVVTVCFWAERELIHQQWNTFYPVSR